MFGSSTLEIAIGISFLYLLLSLVCTTVNEILEIFLKSRARLLESSIRELVGGAADAALIEAILRFLQDALRLN